MSTPDDGITLRPGTDISVPPEELDAPEQPDPGSAEAQPSDEEAMGGTGGGDAGGAG